MSNKNAIVFSALGAMSFIIACHTSDSETFYMKDLEENMLDLRIYHENLGGALKQNDMDIAEWLTNGMDSVLNVMSLNFNKNRKLQKPFDYYYMNRLKPAMTRLKHAIKDGNSGDAIKAYTILTNKCNGCHTDHDIEKEVLNWAK